MSDTTTGVLAAELSRNHKTRAGLDSVQAARFDAIVRRSSARLIQLLDAISLDRELSADAAQEAFVELYLHWDEVGSFAEPEAWVYRVAVNRCKDQRRRLARAARLFNRLVAAPGPRGEEPWGLDADFVSALRRLPIKQRTAAALFYEADLSIAQISTLMGISEGAVNSHLHRARFSLKDLLEAP
jgi:RNA polymerase sigma-70 factor (ECF subfamily)